MHFEIDDDQRDLIEGVRDFCDKRFPIQVARAFGATGGFDRAAWRDLAALGVLAMTAGEGDGGLAMPVADAGLVFGELGRALVPGPLVASHLAAGLVDGVAEGATVAAAVDLTGADRRGHGPVLVEHLRDADVLLTLDTTGVRVLRTADVDHEVLHDPFDPTTPVSLVRELPHGDLAAGPGQAARLLRLGSVLTSSLLAGNADRTTRLAVDYAKQREQFGRPVGSFQAVKHLLADMFVRAEVSRAAVDAAAVAIDEEPAGDEASTAVNRAAASARVLAGRAALDNARSCIQVHGGMGFTWEVDAHLYLKRAWILSTSFGSVDLAAEAVADHVALES
jgi:alkylation response protein AidB-like acyl-CoA dehydrogenase